jgi:hypothetical protein
MGGVSSDAAITNEVEHLMAVAGYVEEFYPDAFFYFIRALNNLACEAEKQCENLDYYNVAWETRDDVLRGAEATLNNPRSVLTQEQKARIERLVAELNGLPSTVFGPIESKEQTLREMNHPAWATLRTHAKELLLELGPEIDRVYKILGLSSARGQ